MRAFVVACVLVAVSACSDRVTVDTITIVNQTSYDVDVSVTGGARDGWLPLTRAPRESERSVEEVLDQGATWVFRFSSAGIEAGQVELSREQLRRNAWKVEVPSAVGDRLRTSGQAPPPKGD